MFVMVSIFVGSSGQSEGPSSNAVVAAAVAQSANTRFRSFVCATDFGKRRQYTRFGGGSNALPRSGSWGPCHPPGPFVSSFSSPDRSKLNRSLSLFAAAVAAAFPARCSSSFVRDIFGGATFGLSTTRGLEAPPSCKITQKSGCRKGAIARMRFPSETATTTCRTLFARRSFRNPYAMDFAFCSSTVAEKFSTIIFVCSCTASKALHRSPLESAPTGRNQAGMRFSPTEPSRANAASISGASPPSSFEATAASALSPSVVQLASAV
mmetsp:Transcript_16431/g.40627  ORF Transcript_16431/g.40627 Transcript_16431/m.40627 type:complete len:266 (+) Transcript_16431:3677-4474(+)